MELWASIDLMKGKVVRLVRGDPSNIIVYSNEPVKIALQWQSMNIYGLHIVDLDAALGLGNNSDTIIQIATNVNIPIQVGGGLRNIRDVNDMLKIADRVVIGTGIFSGQINGSELLQYGTERVVIALDHKNGKIVVNGWRKELQLELTTVLKDLWHQGFRLFLSTNTTKDGTLSGLDSGIIKELEKIYLKGVYIAGGISSINDLIELRNLGVRGVILGRALYDGLMKIDDILKVISR
ncbi:MAG: 1-(5-phosphoribosyl)-5-[(5-phosphoribosylamino)methylideneamino] imidazole-4-carboxamide isomerase [Thermoprotei archaeon]